EMNVTRGEPFQFTTAFGAKFAPRTVISKPSLCGETLGGVIWLMRGTGLVWAAARRLTNRNIPSIFAFISSSQVLGFLLESLACQQHLLRTGAAVVADGERSFGRPLLQRGEDHHHGATGTGRQ